MPSRATASLLVLAIAVAACSGNGDDSPSGPTQSGPGSFQTGIPTFTEGLARPASAFAATRWPYGCAVADFDGDGVQDVFVVERHSPTYGGSGAFVWGDATGNYPQRDLVNEPDLPSACAAADFDGDGDVDVAVARSGASTGGPWMFENLGNRQFAIASAGAFDTAEYAMAALVAFDADDDGDVDLIAGCVEPHYGARFFQNDGTGTFVEDNTRLPPRFPPISRVTHGDLNGDGHDDLVLTGAVWTEIWRNDGTGHFAAVTPTVLPHFAGIGATDHDLLDADGDGDLDIAYAFGGQLRVLFNDGTFVTSTAIPAVTTVRAGDLDGDGDIDLATVGPGGLRLHHNDGTGAFGNVTQHVQGITTLDAQSMLLCEDLDGNGAADLFVARGEPGLRVLRGITAARFASTPEYGTPLNISHVTTGDVDGDGDVDLMTIVGSSGVVRLNDGAAQFTTAGGFALPAGTRYPALGDFDGDGATDLLTESGWIQGDGSGRFIAPFEPWPANLTSIRAVTLIETNGNGRPEAILFGVFGLSLVETDGTRLSLREIRTVNVSSVVAGDLNGDSLDDLVVYSPYMPTKSLLFATGDGGFRDVTERLPSGANLAPLWAADLDLDGDVDLIARDAALKNDGNANFTVSPTAPVGAIARLRDVGALEGGGPPDLLMVTNGMGHHAINKEIVIGHANGAGGYVLRSPFPTIRPYLNDIELADLDGDRDLDIIWAPGVSTARSGGVFVNEHRSLRSSGVAQRGRDYVLQLQQAAGYATSARPALMTIGVPGPPVPVAGVGTLHVSNLFLVVPITLPAPAGRIELRYPVPAAIGAGLEIAAQATFLSGDNPMGLSNPTIDVIY